MLLEDALLLGDDEALGELMAPHALLLGPRCLTGFVAGPGPQVIGDVAVGVGPDVLTVSARSADGVWRLLAAITLHRLM